MQNSKKEIAQMKSKLMKLAFIGVPILLFAWSIWYSQGVKEDKISQVPEILTVKIDDYKKGNPSGKVVLVEYLDFECEACRAYYPLIKQLEKDFPNDLLIVNRYFPLPGHKNSMTAALSAEAAARQGKFYEMHDILFDNQESWGEKGIPDQKQFEKFAIAIGLDMDEYRQEINSPDVKARIERDVKDGNTLGNTGTPSFFLQGKKIDGIENYEDFKSRIQKEIDLLK